MSKLQRLEHRSALAEANKVIASATAQLARLQIVVVALERVGLDSSEARDVLDEGAAHLALLGRTAGSGPAAAADGGPAEG